MAFGIKWLKPELDEPRYWLHLGILLAVVYLLMVWYNPQNMQQPINFGIWLLYLALGDMVAHTSLGLD